MEISNSEMLFGTLHLICQCTGGSVEPNPQTPEGPPLLGRHPDAYVHLTLNAIKEEGGLRMELEGFISQMPSKAHSIDELLQILDDSYKHAILAQKFNQANMVVSGQDLSDLNDYLEVNPIDFTSEPLPDMKEASGLEMDMQ